MRGVALTFGLAEGLHEGSVEDLMDEGGFAGAADSGDAAEEAERDVEGRRRGGCGCGLR